MNSVIAASLCFFKVNELIQNFSLVCLFVCLLVCLFVSWVCVGGRGDISMEEIRFNEKVNTHRSLLVFVYLFATRLSSVDSKSLLAYTVGPLYANV